ncbi:hypothetical protein MMC11_005860 [Xylographa trunciseda]|nr:hypothetical protein [Xylographa trunciseda]
MESLYDVPNSTVNNDRFLRNDFSSIIGRLDHQQDFATGLKFCSSESSNSTARALPSIVGTVSLSQSSTEDVEAAPLDIELEPQLPAQRQNRLLRNVRHKLMSVYKRLFSIYVVANLIALIVVLWQSNIASLGSASNLSIPISVNVLVAALSRTEYVVNILFASAIWIPRTAPLRLRRVVAKVYEYGGVHSGAGFSAALWVVAFTIQMTRAFFSEESFVPSILVFTYFLFVSLIAIGISALPSFRRMQHNSFEAIHRFAAWISVALYWILIMLISSSLQKQLDTSFGRVLIISPSFWILCMLTFLIILPWLRLRKVSAQPEYLSKHAVRLHFDYTKIGPCQGLRISTRPLLEWHSFATIPSTRPEGFSILVSNAGDWTNSNIQSPAPKYWVKGIPVTGFLRVVQLFRKVVIVTTGSGIGPCLSGLIYARQAGAPLQCRLLWSTRDAEPTYGREVVEEVLRADPQAIILNTKPGSPRPDMVALTYRLYIESGAEAVFIISNPKLTYKVKYGLESRGIPAYGPIFDS